MNRYLERLIFEMVQYYRSDTESTQDFVKMEHNKHLCPALEKKCEDILGALEKYHSVAYDIQGLRDMGTDVLIRVTEEEETRYICFQIKSEDDLGKKGFLKTLKSQWFDCESHFQMLSEYYILLCCDGRKNKEKIRLIKGEFAKKDRVFVIDPEFGLTFLRFKKIHIDALIRGILGHEDIVIKEASSLVAGLTPTERGVTYYLIHERIYEGKEHISFEELADSPFLNSLYKAVPDYDRRWFLERDLFEDDENEIEYEWENEEYELRGLELSERLSEDLNTLERDLISMDRGTNTYCVILEAVRPLMVLMMDGEIRYSYAGDDLLEYMMSLFGLRLAEL